MHTVEELVFADRMPEPSSQVALVVILAPRQASMPSDPAHLPEGSFCITTSHLKAGTDFEALRLAQVGILIDELVQLRKRHPHLPIVVAADMNTEPSGPIYSLLATVRCWLPPPPRSSPHRPMHNAVPAIVPSNS